MKPYIQMNSPSRERKERKEKMAQNWAFRNLKFLWLGSQVEPAKEREKQ